MSFRYQTEKMPFTEVKLQCLSTACLGIKALCAKSRGKVYTNTYSGVSGGPYCITVISSDLEKSRCTWLKESMACSFLKQVVGLPITLF